MDQSNLGKGKTAIGVAASAFVWFGLYAGLGITSAPAAELGGMWARLCISAGTVIAFLAIGMFPALIGNARMRIAATVLFVVLAAASPLLVPKGSPFAAMLALNLGRGLGNGFIYAQMGAFLFMLTARQSAFAIAISMCLAGLGAFTVEPLGLPAIDSVLICTRIAAFLLFCALPFAEEKRIGFSGIVKAAPQTLPLFVELFLLSIVYGLVTAVFIQFEQAAELRGIPLISWSITYLAPAAVLLIAVARHRQIDFFSIRWLLVPFMAIFLVPLLVDNLVVALAAELVLLALFQVLEASSSLSFIEIDREYSLPPISSFATLRIGGTLGILLGRVIAITIVSPSLEAAILQGASLSTPTFEATIAIILVALIMWRTFLKYPKFEYGAVVHDAQEENDDVEPDDDSASSPDAQEDDAANDEQKPGVWRRKCDSFAQTYGLSAREKDVLRLLARGRNAVFIGKELYISESTVRTHIAHIYQKASVHSQQDLINLVESQPD